MDQSLDEFIKARKINLRRGRSGAVTKRGSPQMRRGGKRGRGGLRGRGNPRGRGGPRRSISQTNTRKSFQSTELRRPAVRAKLGGGETKLLISNLDFQVNDKDIRELFSEFGPIKSAVVHYDRNARSLGTASVVYERRLDAIKAMKQYNDVPLDGRKMKIEISLSEIPAVAQAMKSGSTRMSSGRFRGNRTENRGQSRMGGSSREGRSRGRGSRGGGRGGRKPLTAEQLDKELDSYIKMDVS